MIRRSRSATAKARQPTICSACEIDVRRERRHDGVVLPPARAPALEGKGATRPWPLDQRRGASSTSTSHRADVGHGSDHGSLGHRASGEVLLRARVDDHRRTDFEGFHRQVWARGIHRASRALGGEYQIKANFYGSRAQQVTGPTTVQATVITDFGRPTEQRRALTLRLTTARDVVDIGAVVAGLTRQGAK